MSEAERSPIAHGSAATPKIASVPPRLRPILTPQQGISDPSKANQVGVAFPIRLQPARDMTYIGKSATANKVIPKTITPPIVSARLNTIVAAAARIPIGAKARPAAMSMTITPSQSAAGASSSSASAAIAR